jgi:hypothetical protein
MHKTAAAVKRKVAEEYRTLGFLDKLLDCVLLVSTLCDDFSRSYC